MEIQDEETELTESDSSISYSIWLFSSLLVWRFPGRYTIDCLIVFFLFPLFFQSSSNQDTPFPVLLLALIYFLTPVVVHLLVSFIKRLKSFIEFVEENLSANSRGDFVDNVLSSLIQESESNKILSKRKKNDQNVELSVKPEDFKAAHVEYLKKLPLVVLQFVLLTFLAKLLVPKAFVFFEILDVLWFSISFAAVVTLYNMLSEMLIVAICIWRQRIGKRKAYDDK